MKNLHQCHCGCKPHKVSLLTKLHGYLHRFFLYFWLSATLTSKYQRFKEKFHEWNEARLDRKYGVETDIPEAEKSKDKGKFHPFN